MSKGKVNHYKPVPKHVHIFKCSSEMLFGFVIKNFHNTCKIVGIDLLISFVFRKMVKTLRQGFERGGATSLLKYKNCLCTIFDCDIKVSFVERKPNLLGL